MSCKQNELNSWVSCIAKSTHYSIVSRCLP